MSSERNPAKLLDYLGINYIEKSGRLSMCCVFHHDTDPSSGFYLDTGLFHCYSCGYTFDDVKFYAKYKEIPYFEAERELDKIFGDAKVYVVKLKEITKRRGMDPAEALLKENKSVLGQVLYAQMGEVLDRIWNSVDRGGVTAEALDKQLEIWYNILTEELSHVGSHEGRASTASVDARFTERMGGVPRPRLEEGSVDLD